MLAALPCKRSITIPFHCSKIKRCLSSYSDRKVLGYPPHKLFEIVSQVDKYQEFLPWCTRSHVIPLTFQQRGPDAWTVQADLDIGFGPVSERYTSLVRCKKPFLVEASASSSALFTILTTRWQLIPYSKDSVDNLSFQDYQKSLFTHTDLRFHVEFQFKNPIYAQLSAAFLSQVSKTMMNAFEKRAQQVYGNPTTWEQEKNHIYLSKPSSSSLSSNGDYIILGGKRNKM